MKIKYNLEVKREKKKLAKFRLVLITLCLIALAFSSIKKPVQAKNKVEEVAGTEGSTAIKPPHTEGGGGKCSHTYGNWSATKRATCTAEGKKVRKCSKCGKTEETSISKINHAYPSSWTITRKATCGAAGSKTKVCMMCKGSPQYASIPATGNHNYELLTVEISATCGRNGRMKKECSGCHDVKYETISATGKHTYNRITVEKNPTCTEKRYSFN